LRSTVVYNVLTVGQLDTEIAKRLNNVGHTKVHTRYKFQSNTTVLLYNYI